MKKDFDFIVIGSGFGGSVSALRLVEKGYSVLVLEKGKRLTAEDFPKTNWNLKRWFWLPTLKFFGFFRLSFFRHVAVLSGVGVGGGSLVYANTLPVPREEFFTAPTWSHLADWKKELMPFYDRARRMLGTAKNPRLETGDLALKELAERLGKADQFETTEVAVFFGEPEKEVEDPYFNGEGPPRSGCRFCGACMIGCRYNAKNTLDKNYLYFAEKKGAVVQPESEVYDIKPLGGKYGEDGYRVYWRQSTRYFKRRGSFTCQGLVFAGGVLGTVPLLLKLKKRSLPNLSSKVGWGVRTNSESLIGITTTDKNTVFSDGIAIGSILHTDRYSHLEPVRYPAGSGFWRVLMSPMISGSNFADRLFKVLREIFRHPLRFLKTYFVDDWAKRTQILLFMQTINTTLRFSPALLGMKSTLDQGTAPTAFIPEAQTLAREYAKIAGGTPTTLLTESLFGIPTTAHILGGAVMGENDQEGVIDRDNRVFGYRNMYICDGSMISANPGVNPSLTITALSERAMSKIKPKKENPDFGE
ncbi:GMC oxidoreductase [Caldithrix abyssi]